MLLVKKNSEYAVAKMVRKTIDRLRLNISNRSLFSIPRSFNFKPAKLTCLACHRKLKVQKTLPTKRVATLEIGDFIAHETVYRCELCGRIFHSEELRSLVPQKCNFGYDVIVFIGESVFLHCRSYQEIFWDLRERNLTISESGIAFLAKKFVIYLSLLHRRARRRIKKFMKLYGGYILHLDGTCEGGSPHLISAIDGITEIVLENIKLPSENAADLIPFLEKIKKAYGVPVAVVSDMAKAILAAVKKVFKKVPHLLCHFHFLRDLGKDLFGEENDVIRKRLKYHGIQSLFGKRAFALKKPVDATPKIVEAFAAMMEGGKELKNWFAEHMGLTTYLLIKWALAGKKQGQGRGFPFDQGDLVFYQRLVQLHEVLHKHFGAKRQGKRKEKSLFDKIYCDLLPVVRDPLLKKAAAKMEGKLIEFNRLRGAMRITIAENNLGLNDNGDSSNIKTIEKAVEKFVKQIRKNKAYEKDEGYQKMIRQLEKYWSMLFADPIIVKTKTGPIVIQPQRTNNISEQHFRKLMRNYCKRNGFRAMEKTIRTMIAATPLVMNLKNQDYLDILLNGNTLAERFAEIDAEEVRDEMKRARSDADKMVSPKIKKIIKNPEFLTSLVALATAKKS